MTIPRVFDIYSDDETLDDLTSTQPRLKRMVIEVGEDEAGGRDNFYLSIVNEAWVEAYAERNLGDEIPIIVTDHLDIANLKRIIQKKIDETSPYDSWPDFAEKVSSYMRWEFTRNTYPPLSGTH